MTCVDPITARTLLEGTSLDAEAWRRHTDECAACRDAFAMLEQAPGAPDLHPAALALVDWDEAPELLSDAARDWIGHHVADCAVCSESLEEVGELGSPQIDLGASESASDGRVIAFPTWAWAATAAAGWIVVLILVVQSGDSEPGGGARGRASFDVPVGSLVLTTERAGDVQKVSTGAQILRLAFVIAEELSVDDQLSIRVEPEGADPERHTARVHEVDEWGRPVIIILRDALPRGLLTIVVSTPSGKEATFRLDNR